MTTLDQSNDVNFSELARYARLYPLPDYVKQAELTEILPPEEQSARFFADVRTPHQFPIHNKSATVVSTLFFLDKASTLSSATRTAIADRLDKAAEYWGITNAVKAIKTTHELLHKEAEYPDSSYAIVWRTDNGHKERRYPMRNALETKAAADWFAEYLPQIRQEFNFSDRQTIASKILEKAAEFGAAITEHSELLERCAGRGIGVPSKTAQLIANRVDAAMKVSPDVATEMRKLASVVATKPKAFLDPASLAQLAETVDTFDRTHALLNKYSAAIPAPEDVLFENTFTKVSQTCAESCTLTTGSIYDSDDFAKLSSTDVRDLFGDDIADAVCTGLQLDPVKLAEVAATFPRGDAEMFDALMISKSVQPLSKTAYDQTLGFSFDDYAAMAATT